jgi:hypothetical protein
VATVRERLGVRGGDLVAIRTRQRNAHLVGRIADAHRGIYSVHRHIRGTTDFADAADEVSDGHRAEAEAFVARINRGQRRRGEMDLHLSTASGKPRRS